MTISSLALNQQAPSLQFQSPKTIVWGNMRYTQTSRPPSQVLNPLVAASNPSATILSTTSGTITSLRNCSTCNNSRARIVGPG